MLSIRETILCELVDFITSGPVLVRIGRNNAIVSVRLRKTVQQIPVDAALAVFVVTMP